MGLAKASQALAFAFLMVIAAAFTPLTTLVSNLSLMFSMVPSRSSLDMLVSGSEVTSVQTPFQRREQELGRTLTECQKNSQQLSRQGDLRLINSHTTPRRMSKRN